MNRKTADTITDDELDALYDAVQRVMDLDVPDVAAAINPAYALGWKDALAIARGVLDPAQRPAAGIGSGAAVADSSTAAGP